MEQYKQEFIDFMIESDVLKFGEFTLKSGRKSPFFMNAGAYVTGTQLRKLGEYYAKAIHDNYGLDFDVLFGPAYKGIPLSVATTMAINELYGKDIRYCSNRKEVKDHGDTGILLGSKLKDGDRVVIIEDVTTSGKSIEETFPIIKAQANVEIKGLIVSLNRCERGKGDKSALQEIQEVYGFPANAIVSMEEVVQYLYNQPRNGRVLIDDAMKASIDAYYEQYGVKA
ncbi:MAG: orotate phosphoribosyltransferase [Oscillospiraceae bacterium]|nr:orotate phosphoribosyltransferase [Oscillospiraceae bacterium]